MTKEELIMERLSKTELEVIGRALENLYFDYDETKALGEMYGKTDDGIKDFIKKTLFKVRAFKDSDHHNIHLVASQVKHSL